MSTDVWPLVHAERHSLIADLQGLTPEQWSQPSRCAGWTVHDVVAHLVDVAESTRLGFARDMLTARFDFDRQNERGIARAKGATPAQTLQRLKEAAARTTTPLAPMDTRIVEEVVHGEDIRRPLGLHRGYPAASRRKSIASAGPHLDAVRRGQGTRRRSHPDSDRPRPHHRHRARNTRRRTRFTAGLLGQTAPDIEKAPGTNPGGFLVLS